MIQYEGYGREESYNSIPFREGLLIVEEDPTLERIVGQLVPQENSENHTK